MPRSVPRKTLQMLWSIVAVPAPRRALPNFVRPMIWSRDVVVQILAKPMGWVRWAEPFRRPAIARQPVARRPGRWRSSLKGHSGLADNAGVVATLPVAADGLARFTRVSCGGSSRRGDLHNNHTPGVRQLRSLNVVAFHP